jgi:N-acetylneuraminic acid mutarotase
MTYDPDVKKIILFGGNVTPTTFPQETWTYDVNGNKWTDVSPPPSESPVGRCHPVMAYDAKSKKHVLFGGRNSVFNILGDTWTYDAVQNKWTDAKPNPSPPPTYHPAMAADPATGKIVFFGGCVNGVGTLSCKQLTDATWVYDPSSNTWSDMKPTKAPPPRDRHHMAWDPVINRALLFGGVGANSKTDMQDTWLYDLANNSWEEVMPATKPPGRDMNPMDFDQTRQMIIMFGGYSSYKDTWYFDGKKKDWVKETPTGSPSGRFGHYIVYDAGAQKSVVFGGWAGSCCVGDTWVYDSGGRVPVPPKVTTTSPGNQATNVDPAANVVVNFDLDMDPTATSAAYSINPNVAGTAAVSGKVLTWTHPAKLAFSTQYSVTIAGTAKSAAGDAMNTPHTFSFTTAADNSTPIPPKIASTNPTDQATGVPVDAKITIVFDKKMDAAATEVAISSTPALTGAFSWDGSGSTVTWTPAAPLAYDTKHTVTVAAGAKSSDGAALGTPFSFSFTTAAKKDDTPPTIQHTPVTAAKELEQVEIKADIVDDTAIQQATLFYRQSGGTWKEVPMAGGLARKHSCHNDVSVECNPVSFAYASDEEMKQYVAYIPNGDVRPPKVEYYIQAEDAAGNLATHPTAGSKAPHAITVSPKDDGGGNNGGSTNTGIGGFLASPAGMALIVGLAIAIAAIAAALVIAKRRKRPPAAAYPGGSQGPPGQSQGAWSDQGQFQQASWNSGPGWQS